MVDKPEDNEIERKKREEGDSGSGSVAGVNPFRRAAGEGVVAASTQEEIDEAQRKKRREGEGEGEASAGKFQRASGEGIARLSAEKQKQVWADWRQLDLNEVVAAVAEFFSEFPARASANCVVAWDSSAKGAYAIVNMAIKFGQDVATAVRERTKESAVQVRKRYGINIKFKQRGGMNVSVPNPQAGLT